MNFELKNNNIDLYHILLLALDSSLFNFNKIDIIEQNGKNGIVMHNTETQTKLTILLYGVSNFEAKIKSKFFRTKKINNYRDYINFISINNFAIQNKQILN